MDLAKGLVRIANLYDFIDLKHLQASWNVEETADTAAWSGDTS